VISAANAANRIASAPTAATVSSPLGVNGFFTGTDAASIQVLEHAPGHAEPDRGRQANFTVGTISPGDNRNALALARLGTSRILAGGTPDADEALGAFGRGRRHLGAIGLDAHEQREQSVARCRQRPAPADVGRQSR